MNALLRRHVNSLLFLRQLFVQADGVRGVPTGIERRRDGGSHVGIWSDLVEQKKQGEGGIVRR